MRNVDRSTGTTTAGIDRVYVETDEVSLTGQEFFVETDALGYYRIRTKGDGVGPLNDERFTSASEAKKALTDYTEANHWRIEMFKKARARGKKSNDETLPDV